MAPRTMALSQYSRPTQSTVPSTRSHSTIPSNSQAPVTSHNSDLVRALMRRVPHPVAIITSTDPTHPTAVSESHSGRTTTHTEDPSEGYRGATVSSFVTVTLSPAAIVCFNITHRSSTYHAVQSSGHFCVHLMNENDDAREIASRFARGNNKEPFHGSRGELEDWVSTGQCGSELVDRASPPVIEGQKAGEKEMVAFWFRCKYLAQKTVELGDHVVLFGEVVEVGGPDRGEVVQELFQASGPARGKVKDKDSCMVYFDGRYSSLKP